jgi:hypothetical protein
MAAEVGKPCARKRSPSGERRILDLDHVRIEDKENCVGALWLSLPAVPAKRADTKANARR